VVTEFVLATANPDKAREIASILGDSVRLLARPDSVGEVDETGATLLDNARLKARAVAHATGRPAIADDTGLEVDAIEGRPGVHSSRYAGAHATYDENVAKLLAELEPVEDGVRRAARFHTVAVVCWPDGREVWAEGMVEGSISRERHGAGGFGYDPVFVPASGNGRTFAEMTGEEKDRVSHRGRAFRALAERLQVGGSPNRPGLC
jgi:XTP/dITP diphosphohydrolase